VGWSQNSGLQNQYVRNTTLSQVKTFKKNNSALIGNALQIANGANFATQFACVYNSTVLPYQFSISDPVSILGKETFANNISNGREGIVTKDSAHYFFTLGDVIVNGFIHDFTPIDDTIIFTNNNTLNNYLISEPFELSNESTFSYSVQYGVTDSTIASEVLGLEDYIEFKVQLVDDLTNEVLGTYDEITLTKQNIIQYENILYTVDVNGIGNRVVRLKLIVNNNFNAGYTLASKYATESTLMKKNSRRIYFNGQEIVETYELAQNFPNPFNPRTTIRYQIPKNGIVTLKLYDILGAEVATLVNEEKLAGMYEVNFSASSLASGVYIYRIQSGDFMHSKKMILLK
ncbi:MAG: T9SS type A sorting domain-containing protein, partial [Ignavibacteria bacterium]|nr:T9SS type A sorting domain-containing protein [Ignavibacteria bacterium]